MRAPTLSHPWRERSPGVQTIDPVASSRSSQFAAYLDTLPPVERRQIEVAERAFVSRSHLTTSQQHSTARDFAASMLGVKEDEPAGYRGFVV